MKEVPQDDFITHRESQPNEDLEKLGTPSTMKTIKEWWNTQILKKPTEPLKFKNMNVEQRKARVRQLWGVIRTMAWAKSSVIRMQKFKIISAEEKLMVTLGLDTNEDEE